MDRVEKKNILVTGGSGGIGRSIVERFAEVGNRVIIFSRDRKKAETALDAITEKGGTGFFFQTDLANPISIKDSVEKAKNQCGAVDILVNNAAISGFMGPVVSTPLDELDEVFRVNCGAAFQLSRDLLPAMIDKKFGRIINISSVASRVTPANSATYNISKAGLDALTRSLSREAAPFGVTVNSIAPGLVLTERIVKSRIPGIAEAGGISEDEVLAKMTGQSDTGKLTAEDEIADLVMFLSSAAAGNITGEIINISGGF